MYDFFIVLLNSTDVMYLHDIAIERFGGLPGLRDRGLLDSAVNHVCMIIYYGDDEDRTIYNLAASYFFHIIKNHAFEDGNKRAGLSAALHFLYINGFFIDVDSQLLYQLAVDTASSKIDKKEVGLFFKENIRQYKKQP